MLRNKKFEDTDLRYREAGEWLCKQRQHWQITQAELAELACIGNVSLIDSIEKGEVALPRFMQATIAGAYGLDRSELAEYCEAWYGQEIARVVKAA